MRTLPTRFVAARLGAILILAGVVAAPSLGHATPLTFSATERGLTADVALTSPYDGGGSESIDQGPGFGFAQATLDDEALTFAIDEIDALSAAWSIVLTRDFLPVGSITDFATITTTISLDPVAFTANSLGTILDRRRGHRSVRSLRRTLWEHLSRTHPGGRHLQRRGAHGDA